MTGQLPLVVQLRAAGNVPSDEQAGLLVAEQVGLLMPVGGVTVFLRGPGDKDHRHHSVPVLENGILSVPTFPGPQFRLPSPDPVSALVCQVSLNKVGEYWWSAILEGEEQIDIDKINKERSMATVDEEEHAVLDRLTFDYHQKLQGKPQSHELVRALTLPGA